MRLDKFLKTARIIKRRSLAKEACERGVVFVNGRVAKAGTQVRPGDRVTIRFGTREMRFEILETRDNVPAKEAGTLYRHLDK
ncbi:MAG: RNA-binding S4 domain-containing protein [Peptococcaceae bacterium]|nr:RNA-binding S4 domain-containing protein [Peptococcaceae bacterium]